LPIDVKPGALNVNDVSVGHSEKADTSIFVNAVNCLTLKSFVPPIPANADLPICVIFSGLLSKAIVENFEHLLKQ